MVKTVLMRRAAALARTAVDDADAARAEFAQTHIASLLPALSRMQRLWAFAFIGIAVLAAASAWVLGPFLPAPPMSVDQLALPWLLTLFGAGAVIVWVAGIRLSDTTDVLSTRLGLGEALGGLLLLAVATNLPEIAIVVSAAMGGDLGLAIGNILGGIAIQTVVLVVLDVWGVGPRAGLTYRAASLVLVLEGVLVIAVLVVTIMATRLPPSLIAFRLAPGDLLIVALWGVGVLEARAPNASGQGAITQRRLLKASFRHRADRIVVGEILGDEAWEMLQAMASGHPGSLATIHAETPRLALKRLALWALMAQPGVTEAYIADWIASTIDIIIQLNYYKPAGLHYVSAVAEIDGREGEVPRLQELWRRKGPHDRLRWTGRRSKLEERFQGWGSSGRHRWLPRASNDRSGCRGRPVCGQPVDAGRLVVRPSSIADPTRSGGPPAPIAAITAPAAKDAVRAKAPEIELLKFRAAAVRLTIRHWRATNVMIGWRPGNEFMPPMKPSPN